MRTTSYADPEIRNKESIPCLNNSGGMPGPDPSITDEELLREIKLLPDPVITAKEITERVDLENATVNRRLDRLVESGYLVEKKVGAAAVVYWMTPEGAEKAAES